jgi:hypothetical protein
MKKKFLVLITVLQFVLSALLFTVFGASAASTETRLTASEERLVDASSSAGEIKGSVDASSSVGEKILPPVIATLLPLPLYATIFDEEFNDINLDPAITVTNGVNPWTLTGTSAKYFFAGTATDLPYAIINKTVVNFDFISSFRAGKSIINLNTRDNTYDIIVNTVSGYIQGINTTLPSSNPNHFLFGPVYISALLDSNNFFSLEVKASGANSQVYVNSKQIASISNAPISKKGSFAINATGSKGSFFEIDKIIIRTPFVFPLPTLTPAVD